MPTEAPHASGTFSVDRDRAVATLRRWQLRDPRDFLGPWLGLAAAQGASRAELRSRRGGLALAFDGRPIARRLLEDPFECAFGDGERAPELLSGLLGALRLRPKRLSVRSGGLVLSFDAGERQRVREDAASLPGTALELAWRGWFTSRLTRECVRRATLARRECPIPVLIDGR